MKYLIASVFLLLSAQSQAAIIYGLTFTGLNTNAVGGTGVVTFNDNALDADGIFDSSTGLVDLEVTLDGFPFELADMLFSAQLDYQVMGGMLTGFDWRADAGFASLSGGSTDPMTASTLGTTMSLFSLFAPCPAGSCDYAQDWVRRGASSAVALPGTGLLLGCGVLALVARRRG